MLDRNHNFKVEKKLKESVKDDMIRIQIGRISNFGLLELSRQRLKVTEDQKYQLNVITVMVMGVYYLMSFINQILRTLSEITFDKPKDKIFLLCNSLLNKKLNEINQTK